MSVLFLKAKKDPYISCTELHCRRVINRYTTIQHTKDKLRFEFKHIIDFLIHFYSKKSMNQASFCTGVHKNYHDYLLLAYVSNHSFSFKMVGTMKVLSSTQETAIHDEEQMFCHL